jgi:SOS-response transcriptional repressor LexA
MLLPEHLADIPAHVVRARRVMTRYMCSDQAFQIPIWDRSNEPVFTMGDTVVIDPAVTPEPGDMVAALIGEAKRPTFAKYVERAANGTRHVALVPLNSDWPEHHISPATDVILGTMTEHTRPRRT